MKNYYGLTNPDFDQWKQRGVYLAQCATWKVASTITGVKGDALKSDNIMDACRQIPHCLRIVKKYRTPAMQAFRDAVAKEVRHLRNIGQLTLRQTS